jgi:uncharacterized caspase-like protein
LEGVALRDIRFLLKPHYETSRALIVGIDTYKNASPLSYAVSDASEVREVLVNELEFLTENIVYLTEAEATKESILRSFMRFTGDDIGLDDRIFVFFAGHGRTRNGIRGDVRYLVAYDSDINDFSTYIRWDDLTRNSDLVRAKHMLFVMDACYGGLALTRSLQAGSTRFLKDMLLRYTRQVLTAGKANEVVADSGGPLPNHSIFTGHLIEGLRGKAATAEGVITANGLMDYVYQRVANDKNSNQTPHYGYFDGDGDFILRAPELAESAGDERKDLDSLIVVPFTEEEPSPITTDGRIATVKALLGEESSTIKLHDFLIQEVRRFLSETSEDHFPVQEAFSPDQFRERITKYEDSVLDLSSLLACVAYWAKPNHKHILQKALSRSTDRLSSEEGNVPWVGLRWYPILLLFYCSGIAAVEGQRYDSLADIFYAKVPPLDYFRKEIYLIGSAARRVSGMEDIFKLLPGHERQYVPLSEYLYKILQPKLDDILFISKHYERAFDEFEVLFALAAIDLRRQNEGLSSTSIGRFGWKHANQENGPFARLVHEAETAGEKWLPINSGLFGGSLQRFKDAAVDLEKILAQLRWY